MKKIMDWLSLDVSGFTKIASIVVLAAVFDVAMQEIVRSAIISWGIEPAPDKYESPFKYLNVYLFADMVLIGPLLEELFFRIVPLTIVIMFVSTTPRAVFGIMIAFAALFGSVHAYPLLGQVEVAIGGFFFGLVFLKCGGLNKSFVKASAAAIATHGVSNLFLTLSDWWRYLEMSR